MAKQIIYVVLAAISLLVFSGNSIAEITNDKHITSDNDSVSLDIDSCTYNEVRQFLEQGYPVSSVMLHGVILGLSIDDVVYLATTSNVERAQEIYDTAIDLLPSLPGWSCRNASDSSSRYEKGYDAKDLGSQPSLQAIADRFFGNEERMVPFPEWLNGKSHVNISTDELISNLKEQWWYKLYPGKPPKASLPIFVSLYKDNSEVIVDSNYASILNSAKQRGIDKLPTVIVYNEELQRPISRYGNDPTVELVASKFFSEGEILTPPPDWREGDYHMFAKMDELKEQFEIPDKDKVDPERWEQLTNDLKQKGVDPPVLIILYRNGSRKWINEADRVAAAAELGMTEMPVVFFNHSLGRLACGETAGCDDLICEAAMAAGASSDVCDVQGQQSPTSPPPSGGGDNPSSN